MDSIELAIFILLGVVIVVILFGEYIFSLLRITGKMMFKIVIGALIIFFFNIFGQLFDVYLPINIFTSTSVGILGFPGLLTLLAVKIFII